MYNLVFLKSFEVPENGWVRVGKEPRLWPVALRGKKFDQGDECPEMEYPQRRELLEPDVKVLGRPEELVKDGAVHLSGSSQKPVR